MLARGATNLEMSKALCVSINTVKTHVRHIMGKLKTSNRAETALAAAKLLEGHQQGPFERTP